MVRLLVGLLVLAGCGETEDVPAESVPGRYAVIPPDQAEEAVFEALCTHPRPEIDGGWVLTARAVARLEDRLGLLEAEITVPAEMYYRQYTGVMIDGQRRVFVAGSDERDRSRAETALLSSCHGRTGWVALFNPENGTFHDFTFTGPIAPGQAGSLEDWGELIFEAKACTACHALDGWTPDPEQTAKHGPPLNDWWGTSRPLREGSEVIADSAYVRSSILTPSEEVSRGYPDAMPSYEGHLSEGQITALTAFLACTSAEGRAPGCEEAGFAP